MRALLLRWEDAVAGLDGADDGVEEEMSRGTREGRRGSRSEEWVFPPGVRMYPMGWGGRREENGVRVGGVGVGLGVVRGGGMMFDMVQRSRGEAEAKRSKAERSEGFVLDDEMGVIGCGDSGETRESGDVTDVM